MRSRIALFAGVILIALIGIGNRLAIRSLLLEGNAALRRNEFQAAQQLFTRALERRPASGAARLGSGVSLYGQGRYEDAVQDFDRAGGLLESASDRARAYFNRGNASFALGNLHDALEAYRMALRFDPADEDARYNYALVRQRLQSEQQSGASRTSREGAEQLVGALGQPRVKVYGKPIPLPTRPAPGSSPSTVDK
jgi:tetratricopeptide (TPR) repeat protein